MSIRLSPASLKPVLLFLGLAVLSGCTGGEKEPLDMKLLSKASGFQGSYSPETNVFRIDAPRSNLNVTVAGARLTPALGLTAWARMTGTPHQAVVLGDIPLLEGEVNGVLRLALNAGLTVTSLHNTFLWDNPRMMSMHFSGSGASDRLARSVGEIFHAVVGGEIPKIVPERLAIDPARSTLDPSVVSDILFWKGELKDGVYRITTGRGAELKGQTIGHAMGVETWADFAGSNEHAVVNGDVAMLESELSDVLKALIDARIQVLSIHTHMTEETPRLIFVHFWGSGSFVDLAKGLKASLVVQKNFRGST